jgi:hypothetical protein
MGLPMARLAVATNENDILARFWKSGRYEKVDSTNIALGSTTEMSHKKFPNDPIFAMSLSTDLCHEVILFCLLLQQPPSPITASRSVKDAIPP